MNKLKIGEVFRFYELLNDILSFRISPQKNSLDLFVLLNDEHFLNS